MSSLNETLKLITYNIDSVPYNAEERLASFISIITSTTPDVVLIQECGRVVSEKLFREMHILGYKKFVPSSLSHMPSEIIFSKHVLTEGKALPFNSSNESKSLVVSKVNVWSSTNVWVCTTQMDFGISQKRSQIKDLDYMLKRAGVLDGDIVILGGDLRLREYQSDLVHPEGWLDAWYESGNDKEKYTVNHETNPLVSPPNKDRADRIWYKGRIECCEYKLIGTKSPIPSSHYGILTTFNVLV